MEVKAKAVNAQLGRASTGSPQIAIEFYVMSKGKHEAAMVTYFGNLSGGALAITTEQLRHTGWDGDLKNLASICRNPVRLSLEENEKELSGGRTVTQLRATRIGAVNRELVKERLSDAEIDALQATMGGREREPGDDDQYPDD